MWGVCFAIDKLSRGGSVTGGMGIMGHGEGCGNILTESVK